MELQIVVVIFMVLVLEYAAGVSDVCMGDRDIGDGGDKNEIDRADNGIDGENDA